MHRLRVERPVPAAAFACLAALLMTALTVLNTSGAAYTATTNTTATWATNDAYSTAVASDTPAGYWHVGETGATFADSSGNNRPLTVNGSGGQGVTGIPGSLAGKAFTTGTVYGSAPDAAWNSPTGSFAIEAWLKPSGSTAEAYLVEKYDAPGYNGFILRMSGGVPYAYTLNASGNDAVTGPVLTAGTWAHLVFSYDSATTTGTLYVNGAVANTATMRLPADGAATMKVGARGDDAWKVAIGDLDEVAFYNHTLSAARVSAHYTAGTTAP